MLIVGGQTGIFAGTHAYQSVEVVGQHLGVQINQHCMLRQPRDTFNFFPVLEPLVRLLNAPTLVVQIAKDRCREIHLWQIGGQHPDLASDVR